MENLKTLTVLFRATNSLERIIREDVFQYGLNISEFGVLEALYHKGQLTVKQVIEKVLIANSSMTYVLDILIKKNYITRKQSETDKRSFVLELTETGKKLMDKIFPLHEKNMRAILDCLNAEEEKTLQRALIKIGKGV
jgi:MarR family 2-MHQ and catechol resistance regulon transcriptional repressor